jgi:hypothetical protein
MAHLGKRKVSGRQATRDLDNGMSSDDEDLEVRALRFCTSDVQAVCASVLDVVVCMRQALHMLRLAHSGMQQLRSVIRACCAQDVVW